MWQRFLRFFGRGHLKYINTTIIQPKKLLTIQVTIPRHRTSLVAPHEASLLATRAGVDHVPPHCCEASAGTYLAELCGVLSEKPVVEGGQHTKIFKKH